MKKSILFLMMLLAAVTASAQDIFDRLDNALGVSLSAEYKNIIRNNETMQKVLLNDDGFTEQFIKEQMKEDWGISKDNQYLFMWSKIYQNVTGEKFYDFTNDENRTRKLEYAKNSKKILTFSDNYRNSIINYMQQRSAEARRQSEEARQQSAEARQGSTILLHSVLVEMIKSYKLRNSAFENEIKGIKELGRKEIQRCIELNIDYHALLPLEVQRFYDIKPTNQQNTLTCEKAIVQILNITLDEIVKLYNICQQAPYAEREKQDIKGIIEKCQEYNVDYKSKLTPEIRRYFGIE